jgi:hypothetical protein
VEGLGGRKAEGGGGARKTTGSGVVPRGEDREERKREMDGERINLREGRRKNNRSRV